MKGVPLGYDRRSLLVPVTGNLDNLVYFVTSAVALGRRSSPLAEGEAAHPLTSARSYKGYRGYRSKRLLVR
jgi:hypothetical protein